MKVDAFFKVGGAIYNEKIAYEEALSFSWVGKRAVLEVEEKFLSYLYDPLLSSAYTGVSGAMVVHVVEENGYLGEILGFFSKCPVIVGDGLLEEALEISERFKIPVIYISKERVGNTLEVKSGKTFSFKKDPGRWAATPRFRFKLHGELNRKLKELEDFFQRKREAIRWEGDGEPFISTRPREGFKTLVVPYLHPLPKRIVSELSPKSIKTDSLPILLQLKGLLDISFVEKRNYKSSFKRSGNLFFGRNAIGVACGVSRFSGEPALAVLDEEEFFHSGIPSLINAYYNGFSIGVVVKVKEREDIVKKICRGIGLKVGEVSAPQEALGRGMGLFLWRD